jgi:hypothetical protein
MKNFINYFFLILILFSQESSAQVKVHIDCSNLQVPVDLKFSEKFAIVEMKKTIHKLPYAYGHINEKGDRYSVYQNSELRVSTTYPADSWVNIATRQSEYPKSIASGICLVK